MSRQSERQIRLTTLKKNSDFLSLKTQGRKVRPCSWLIINAKFTGERLRLGVTASRKVGPAVLRNKLKRWSKEFFRKKLKETHELQFDINVVFLPRKPGEYKELSASEFHQHLEKVLQQIRKS